MAVVAPNGRQPRTRNGREGKRNVRKSDRTTRISPRAGCRARSRSFETQIGSTSTAMTCAPLTARARVKAPEPAPMSMTSSPGSMPASPTNRSAASARRKFCPRRRLRSSLGVRRPTDTGCDHLDAHHEVVIAGGPRSGNRRSRSACWGRKHPGERSRGGTRGDSLGWGLPGSAVLAGTRTIEARRSTRAERSTNYGPKRSHRFPQQSKNTATWPYGSLRGSRTNSTPARVMCPYWVSKSSTRRKNPTRSPT